MNQADRAFWLAVYRALCAIAKAIKKRWLECGPSEPNEYDNEPMIV